MPIKKPKARPLPTPFAAQEASTDDHARRRAVLMKREMDNAEGFSWSDPEPGFFERIRNQPRHKTFFAIGAGAMGVLLVGSFLFAMDSGIEVPERVVFFENWGAGRTAQDAVDQREADMDKLRAQIMENRRVHEAQLARQKALEAERAAAQQASS